MVEDEFLIRVWASDELRDAGYDVIEAFNADEALTVLKSHVRVDLIISDVRMPGSFDGMGLLARIMPLPQSGRSSAGLRSFPNARAKLGTN